MSPKRGGLGQGASALFQPSELLSGTGEGVSTLRLSEIEPRGNKMIVTPREIDTLISRAAALISHAINCALQKSLSPDDLMMLVS